MITLMVSAQEPCALTLDQVHASIKNSETEVTEKLTYKISGSFDFKNFTPADGKVTKKNFYEVAYNDRGIIREIIRHDSLFYTSKMLVHYFDQYKIIFLKYDIGGFSFAPIAFYLSDKERYSFTFVPLMGKNKYSLLNLHHKFFIPATPTMVSCIMKLDANLFPTEYFMLDNGVPAMRVKVNYVVNTYSIRDERVSVLFNSTAQLKKLDASSCVSQLGSNFDVSDISFTSQPRHYVDGRPLWIYFGANEFK